MDLDDLNSSDLLFAATSQVFGPEGIPVSQPDVPDGPGLSSPDYFAKLDDWDSTSAPELQSLHTPEVR